MIEAGVGLTFSRIALDSVDNIDKFARNTQNAQAAYNTVVRFRDRVNMSATQSEELDGKMKRLRSDLSNLDNL
jgi:hypothetical protein